MNGRWVIGIGELILKNGHSPIQRSNPSNFGAVRSSKQLVRPTTGLDLTRGIVNRGNTTIQAARIIALP